MDKQALIEHIEKEIAKCKTKLCVYNRQIESLELNRNLTQIRLDRLTDRMTEIKNNE